jgi:hypothetical protein
MLFTMTNRVLGSAIGRLCEKCDGKWYADVALALLGASTHIVLLASPVCDSYVRPETLVRICDECNFGTYGGRCIICGSPGASILHSCMLSVRLITVRRDLRRVLLRRVHATRKRQGWLPQDRQLGREQDGSLL